MCMDWLNRLLGTDAPADTSLRAAELHLRGGVPASAVALFLIAFAALAFTLYFRERLLRAWWPPVTMAFFRTTARALLWQATRARAWHPAGVPSSTAADTRPPPADAFADLPSGGEGAPPAAVVHVTDGQDNASKLPLDEAAKECARLGVPVHVYGV